MHELYLNLVLQSLKFINLVTLWKHERFYSIIPVTVKKCIIMNIDV
jgi:hypothetical protein